MARSSPARVKKPRVKKPFNKKGWLISQLRRLSLRYPPAIRARNRTKEIYFIKSKTGKDMKRVKFKCELCGKIDLKNKETNLDHIHPVVKLEGFTTWEEYLDRLFVQEDGYQLICLDCHSAKTLSENQMRKEVK